MIPDFADERINKKIAKMKSDDYGQAEYIIAPGIRMKIFAFDSSIELYFWDVRGKFAKIEYDPEPYCWLLDGWCHTGISSGKLMEFFMSISDDLTMWLLWNQIL